MEKITFSKKNLLLALLIQFFAVAGFAQSQTFNSSGTFTAPAGVTSVTVEVWGGGGKGGDRSTASSGSGGGGGGGYAKKLITVIPGNNYTVTVGTGSTTTAAGGDSYFINNTTVLAKGGNSVASNATTGATGGAASAYGDVVIAGGNGATAATTYGGGGGAGAINSAANFNGSASNGGATNGTPGSGGPGSGGNGRTGSTGSGSTGVNPGGGGGGSYRTSGGTVLGGNGANGQVIVSYGSEIDIQGNAVSIADGTNTASTVTGTDFGNVTVGLMATRTFTIYNTGNSTLTIGAITFTGTNASEFTILTAPASSVIPGASTTFVVKCLATATGSRTATINIVDNDSDENPYDFKLAANALPVEIDLQGNSVSIASGSTVPTTANWTDFGATDVTGGTLTRTFTIKNTLTGTLSIGAITFSGANAADFTVTTAPSTSVPGVGSTTFVVTFDPSATGTRTATISILNNDTDENPYTFALKGTGIDPEINVQGNATNIADGDVVPSISDWTIFASADVTTGTSSRTYTIQNLGVGILHLGAVTITGTNASDYTVTTAPPATIAAGGSATFTVTFDPSASGLRSATINIANDDLNENPYDFAILGSGTTPEINVTGNGVSIVDGDTTPSTTDWTNFGGVAITSGTITRTFTIQNTIAASGGLSIGAITFTGTNASDFTVTTAPASAVGGNSSTTFIVTFDPSGVGTRTATIHIVNNDIDENPYDFAISGTGIDPEINIQGNGNDIADGTTSTSTATNTDFGSTDINTGTVSKTFTIQNLGTVVLNVYSVTITGTNAADFTVTTAPASTVAASGSTTFTVTFNPSGLLARNATVNVLSDDIDETTYDYAISGYGYIDTDGDGIENTADKDDDNDGILDSVECATCTLDPFVNGGFETPVIGTSTYSIMPTTSVPGWQTSAENYIEIWSTGFMGVPAAAGNQFAELNANVPGLLYQTFCLAGSGGTISWSVKHRARVGIDQAFVKFGPDLAGLTTIATMVDNTSAWGTYSGTYSIPVGQTQILLAFEAGYTGSGNGSIGNFIDDIQIIIQQNCRDTDGDGIPNSLDLDSDNDGIPDIEEGGFKAYSSNLSKVSPMTDTNSNGFLDALDAKVTAGTYSIPDTDGDGVPDYLDLDSDNDSIFDVDESNLLNGDGDINGDGFGDGPDTDGDGILDLFDTSTSFGTASRPFANDSDSDGIADYLELDANNDGVKDILTTLYGSYDANLDGKIDGTTDADADGIPDSFDTKPTGYGSPRDLNRKLFLDFDGRNDYGQAPQMLSGLTKSTIMAWVKLTSPYTATGVVIGQDNFQLKVDTSSGIRAAATANGITVYFSTALQVNRWYHLAAVYDASNATEKLKLFVNGRQEVSSNNFALNTALATSTAKFSFGKNALTSTEYFKGSIDEVRIFNTALSTDQLQKMVYQEIKQNGTFIRGEIVPKDIELSTWANLIAYYRMDAYKDDVIDNYVTSGIDSGTSTSYARIYNHKVIKYQLAPMPFITTQAGALDTAVSQNNFVYGPDVYTYDWSILQMKHNINLQYNMGNAGLFVDPGITFNMNNDNALKNMWYLKLDGKLDLQGKAQLVQGATSELDVTSAGYIERDQQGTVNKWNYNYWGSPVSTMSTASNNLGFTVNGVLRDGTNAASPQNITWTSGLNGSPTTPITLSSYWIFKFQNVTNAYANWATVGPNGALLAGQGYTLKGDGAATATQNYTFTGKPNNGDINSPIAANNLNLSGNPYASAIDANQFINDNLGAITGTIYFWQHFSTNNTHVLQDYQGGYATRTLVGGTPPVAPTGISGSGSSSRIPNRFIPVGQGFFVAANTTGGQVKFNNGQRAFVKEDDATSNIMFRPGSASAMAANQDTPNNNSDVFVDDTYGKIRLGFDSANNYHRQILIGFMDDKATAGLDPGYDAINFDNQPNDMYFVLGSNRLNIEGDSYFNVGSIYPLGVKTGQSGIVNFTLDGEENFSDSQAVYIYDSVTNLYHNLKNGNFQIQLEPGTVDTRFSLRFTGGSLGTDEVTVENGIIVAHSSANGTINIKNDVPDAIIKGIEMYNMLGQSISTWDVEVQDQHNIVIPVKNLADGTYIIKMKTTKGDISKKVIIK